MRCPSCRKKVVFGSIRPDAWERIHTGEWLLGGRPPKIGGLGDCPVCGARLEWEPGEQIGGTVTRAAPPRVHLSALRESPQAWSGDVALRALVIEWANLTFASDSWRTRKQGGTPESDVAMLERLAREQVPRLQIAWSATDAEKTFRESARMLDGDARAAWAEIEGTFVPGEGGGVVSARLVTSIWPPRD